MNQDEADRNQWWEGLTESERNIWIAQTRSAGADAWQLKKAPIFDRDVTFTDLLWQSDRDISAPAVPSAKSLD